MMIHTDADSYNLLWLENAMTLPVGYLDQHYYLDARTNNLFALINMEENDCMTYVDRFYQELDVADANELSQRLATEDNEMSQVFEIPRFTIDEKMSLQLEFITNLPGGYHNSKLSAAVKQQPNDSSFVLDFVVGDNHNQAFIAKYWDEYKLETISRLINQFIPHLNTGPTLAVA
ncbi:MAG: hypothetical protein ABI308_16245 [Mucilaginibacter sp.]